MTQKLVVTNYARTKINFKTILMARKEAKHSNSYVYYKLHLPIPLECSASRKSKM